MTAANTDLLRKVTRKWVGSIGSGGVADDTVATVPLASPANLTTETAVMVTVDRVDANGVATPDKEEGIIGIVSGNNLINCLRGVEGTAQAHSAGAVVEVLWTAKNVNDMVDAFLAEHKQSGAHDETKVAMLAGAQTLTGVKTFGATPKTDAINEKTANAGVTVDGLLIKDGNAAKATVLSTTAKARAYLAANQSIPNESWTKLTLNTESYDPGGNFDHTTNYRFTAPVAGYYSVAAMIHWQSAAGGVFYLSMKKDGSEINVIALHGITANTLPAGFADILYLEADNYLEFFVYHNSGAAKNVLGGSNQTWAAFHLLSV